MAHGIIACQRTSLPPYGMIRDRVLLATCCAFSDGPMVHNYLKAAEQRRRFIKGALAIELTTMAVMPMGR
jgi:hypothetical protein